MRLLKFNPKKDMKELEKYGFEKWAMEHCCNKYAYIYDCKGKKTIKIVVHKDNTLRIVNVNNEVMLLLYDLIKADLLIVEGVE